MVDALCQVFRWCDRRVVCAFVLEFDEEVVVLGDLGALLDARRQEQVDVALLDAVEHVLILVGADSQKKTSRDSTESLELTTNFVSQYASLE